MESGKKENELTFKLPCKRSWQPDFLFLFLLVKKASFDDFLKTLPNEVAI